jgi:hypothetical protein
MVPPDDCEKVWQYVTRARTELRDPGLFRWPHHANLLYSFLDVQQTTVVITTILKMQQP